MILEVGDWIIKKASLQVTKWGEEGYPEHYVTVNGSVKNFSMSHSSRGYMISCKATPDSLVVEITEFVVVENSKKALQIVTRLNDLVISTALEDFGTGYSSLANLTHLPFQ